jgi:hypothetical protein
VLIITIKEVNSRNLETKVIKIVYNSAVGDSVFQHCKKKKKKKKKTKKAWYPSQEND